MKKVSAGEAATVVVKVPEDADLFIDGQKSRLTSVTHTFVTPALEPNQTYYYELKAEIIRAGQLVASSKRVLVRAGEVARVEFDDLPSARTASARITVRLPEEARLYVDGQACPLTSSTRTFDTPQLDAGRAFYYTLKAEVELAGRLRSESQRVLIQPGKPVEVRFDNLLAETQTASR